MTSAKNNPPVLLRSDNHSERGDRGTASLTV